MIRRRHHRQQRPAVCMTPGCCARRAPRLRFCRSCWYQLPCGARLTIQEARESNLMVEWGGLCRDSALILATRLLGRPQLMEAAE